MQRVSPSTGWFTRRRGWPIGIVRKIAAWHARRKHYEALAAICRTGARSGIRGIACSRRIDGGGAQLHGQISAFAFAAAAGVEFFYNPPERIDHGAGLDWLESWRSFLDFRTGIAALPADMPLCDPLSWMRSPAPQVIGQTGFFAYCERHPETYSAVQEPLRRRCSSLTQHPRANVLAVHIRRGDAHSDTARLTPIEKIAATIETICRWKPDLLVEIHSEGRPEEFGGLPPDCQLRLNEDPVGALADLANAEILVMAKSSFSYVAGFLSRGTIIYEPFWHKPLPHWIPSPKLLRR